MNFIQNHLKLYEKKSFKQKYCNFKTCVQIKKAKYYRKIIILHHILFIDNNKIRKKNKRININWLF